MARRKRLSAFGISEEDPKPEVAPQRGMPPVARMAGDAAARSALDELAHEMHQARENGRLVMELALDAIEAQHLTRDRMAIDPEDMDALIASIRSRGQQSPIEVVALDGGRYGLISGARRLAAFRHLKQATNNAQFDRIKALLRPASTAPDAYLAMVEENEIRSDLSFYERGRLAYEAARLGVFASPADAVKALFVHVSPSKRSKILNFVALHEALGPSLHFPEAIPEKLGLALVREIQRDPELGIRIRKGLEAETHTTAKDERALLDKALQDCGTAKTRPLKTPSTDCTPCSTVRLKGSAGRIVISGKGVTDRLIADLEVWLRTR